MGLGLEGQPTEFCEDLLLILLLRDRLINGLDNEPSPPTLERDFDDLI